MEVNGTLRKYEVQNVRLSIQLQLPIYSISEADVKQYLQEQQNKLQVYGQYNDIQSISDVLFELFTQSAFSKTIQLTHGDIHYLEDFEI